jgi:hypothetical protein
MVMDRGWKAPKDDRGKTNHHHHHHHHHLHHLKHHEIKKEKHSHPARTAATSPTTDPLLRHHHQRHLHLHLVAARHTAAAAVAAVVLAVDRTEARIRLVGLAVGRRPVERRMERRTEIVGGWFGWRWWRWWWVDGWDEAESEWDGK